MIIFFINRSNDIDHIVPIVYKMAISNPENVLILCMNPLYDIDGDYRLNFLKNSFNVKIDYLYSFYCDNFTQRLFALLIKSRYFQGSLKKTVRAMLNRSEDARDSSGRKVGILQLFPYLGVALFKRYLFSNFFNVRMIKKHFNEKWTEELFDRIKPTKIVFDFAARSGLFIVDQLISQARKRDIDIVFIPHGLYYFPPKHWQMSNQIPVLLEQKPDAIVVAHKMWAQDLVSNSIPEEKIHVIGSARFCSEWMEKLHTIRHIDNICEDPNASRLRVLYVERQGDRHGEYKTVVQETLRKISDLTFVHLLVQPSTRSGRVHFDTTHLPEGSVSYEDSVSLCKWADVVICLSSIMFEVLLQDKLYLNAKYLHGETLLSEQSGVGLVVNNYEELENALERLNFDRKYRPYSPQEVDKFMIDMVYGGEKGRDVLGRYKDFLMKKTSGVSLGI